MVSVLNSPPGGSLDDSSGDRRSHRQSPPTPLVSFARSPGTPAPAGGALRIQRDSPSSRDIVLPQSAARPARRSTWSSLTRRPGQPWRVRPPAGPAMPPKWVHRPALPLDAAAPMPAGFCFGDLQLSEPVRRAVWEAGYRQPMPIQGECIPALLAGKDCVGQAHTGTGKTAAFGLPIVERVDPHQNVVQAIVLVPTRELCRQVTEEIERLGRHRGARVLAVYGGEAMDRQLRALREGVHVVVGTPGRVQDHIWRGTLRLDGVRIVILDEADEMLDVGFAEDIERILRCVPKERQTALFSATIPPFVHRLVRRYLADPQWVSTIESEAAAFSRIPSQIRQQYVQVAERDKLDALEELVKSEPGYDRVLVFRRMKITSDRLADAMQRRGHAARALHGDLPQAERNRVLEDFRNGRIRFLVATNVAARGLDIHDVSHVLNYDLPETVEEYTHRIGRTGRAGKQGTAISFVAEWDFESFEAIKGHVGDALKERPLAMYGEK